MYHEELTTLENFKSIGIDYQSKWNLFPLMQFYRNHVDVLSASPSTSRISTSGNIDHLVTKAPEVFVNPSTSSNDCKGFKLDVNQDSTSKKDSLSKSISDGNSLTFEKLKSILSSFSPTIA